MNWQTRVVNCYFGLAILLPTIIVGDQGSGKGAGADSFDDSLPKGTIARLGTTRWRVGGHVNALAFSRDDQFLASGSVDDTVRIWESGTGKELKRFSGHKPWVTSVAYTPDGSRLASAGADKVIRLRDVKSGKEIRSFKGHQGPVACVAFSPKGDILASGSGDKGNDMRLGTPTPARNFTGSNIGARFNPWRLPRMAKPFCPAATTDWFACGTWLRE